MIQITLLNDICAIERGEGEDDGKRTEEYACSDYIINPARIYDEWKLRERISVYKRGHTIFFFPSS